MQTKFSSVIFALLSFTVLMGGCYQKSEKREIPPPMVRVAQAQKQDVRMSADFTGKTRACESVSIPARVQGFLEKMTFTPGQIVKKGDPLFIIEQTQYQAAVQQAKANVTTARADLEYAKSDHDRTVELFNSNKAMTLDDVQDRARNLERAQAAVDSAEAALVEAELQLSYTEINAPINGKISRNLIDVGNLVSEFSSLQTPLATIENMDPIYVYFEISDRDFYHFIELYGSPSQIAETDTEGKEISPWPFAMQLLQQEEDDQTATIGGQYPFQGIVNYIDNTINPTVGSITVRGEIKNPDFTIYPGAACRVKVPANTLKDATIVYERAIGSDFNHHYMFVLNKENKVERRMVEKGPAVDRETCVILSGIEPGETYVVEGLQKVRVDETVDAKPYELKKAGLDQKTSEPKKPAATLELPGKDAFLPLPEVTDEEETSEAA